MAAHNDSSAANNDTISSTDTGKSAMDMSGTCETGIQDASGQLSSQLMNNERLQALARIHEIRVTECLRLKVLEKYEIVILCDDSGSMNMTVDGTTKTRWDELRERVKLVIEIATIFDTNGVDVYFLNREGKLRIMDPKDIDHLFTDPPTGYTPLTRVMQKVLQSPEARPDNEKKLSIFIATDGAP